MSTTLKELSKKSARRSPQPQTRLSTTAVERSIAEGLQDIREGRVKGPYRDADSFLKALHEDAGVSKPRDTYKYLFKVGNKIVHGGITNDLERREREYQQKWPKGHIRQVGKRTTEEAAREWEQDKGFS